MLTSLFQQEAQQGCNAITSRACPKSGAATRLNAPGSPDHSIAPAPRTEPYAIVMQGPEMAEDNFTVETLKLYAAHMPDCRLIFSTWADTPAALRALLDGIDVEIPLNEQP
jgi:hypothetical protein